MSEAVGEVEALREEVEQLRERVEELESSGESSTKYDGQFDSRDGSVLDALTGNEGQTFHVRQLVSIYRKETDIRRKETLKSRVQDLVRSEVFEAAGGTRHTFVGHDGDDSQ